jgi:PilZ domain
MRNHGMELVPGRKEERFHTTLPVKLARGDGVTRNVSATGIYFITSQTLKEGAEVRFALDFQDFPGGAIQVNCIARVVRIEEQDGKNKGVAAAIQSFEFQRLPKRDTTS